MVNNDQIKVKQLWEAVLSDVEVSTSKLQFNTLFKNTRAEELNNNTLQVICTTSYVRDFLKKKFLDQLYKSLEKVANKKYAIEFEIEKTQINVDTKNAGPLFEKLETTPESLKPKTIKKEVTPQQQQTIGLYADYTFDNYVIGENNQMAFATAIAITQEPGKKYNPFFIWSGVGLGKTHLMHAIGNKLMVTRPDLKIVYTTGESFMNELVESIQSGKSKRIGKYATNDFRNKYRNTDVLLIDDIQYIIGKESTQDEFFHTFNTLHLAKKQIIMTSDRPPKEFSNLKERIKSRFGSGLIVDIQAPDLETRTAILRNKRDQSNEDLPNEVIDFIALKVDTNIRELEGAYIQVLTKAKATKEPLDEKFVAQALGSASEENTAKPINLNQILKTVCKYYAVKANDIKGKRRTKEIVIPRQMAMYLMHTITETPYTSIGTFLGGRDHTTVMHGVKKIEEDMQQTARAKQEITSLRQMIYM